MLKWGTYLTQRWEDQGRVKLHHCADEERGFFIEVGVKQEKLVVLRSFVSAVPLQNYTHYMRLPKWWGSPVKTDSALR